MLRSLLRASAAVAIASLLAPAAPGAASAPGLAYDEIVRVVVNATPPPPGNFSADLAAIDSAPAVAAVPTPAPKKHGLSLGTITSIAGSLAGGLGGNGAGVAGAVANQVVSTAIAGAMSSAIQRSIGSQFAGLAAAAQNFLQPHLTRYAYWNGWVREDDVAAQTATIRKCDAGQVIRLDLARKTYTIYDPAAEPTDAPAAPAPAPRRRGPEPAETPQQPGTAVISLTSTTKALAPLRIQDQATTGYDSTTTLSVSQSTGSCHDSSASFEDTQYLASVARPVVNGCPIRRRPIPQSAEEMATAPAPVGGCRPTLTARRSGPTPPSNRLALYSLMSFSGGAGAGAPSPGAAGSGPIGFLTERGNLKQLGPADAGLFAIPEGFTKSP